MNARGAAILASLGAALAACILVVPDKDMSLACQFSGEDTACGQCLARHCQDAVNACCGDTACETGDMPNVDSCASRGDCAALLASTGRAGAIAQCATASCAEPCARAADGGPVTAITCLSLPGEACSCSPSSAFSDAGAAGDSGVVLTSHCAASDFGGTGAAGACCAFGDAGDCVCVAMRCQIPRDSPTDCACGRYASDPSAATNTSLCDPTGASAHCCSSPGRCACTDQPCADDAGEVEVTTCDQGSVAGTIRCADGGVKVLSCK